MFSAAILSYRYPHPPYDGITPATNTKRCKHSTGTFSSRSMTKLFPRARHVRGRRFPADPRGRTAIDIVHHSAAVKQRSISHGNKMTQASSIWLQTFYGNCRCVLGDCKQLLATTSVRGGILQAVGCGGVSVDEKVSFSVVFVVITFLSLRMRESRGCRR